MKSVCCSPGVEDDGRLLLRRSQVEILQALDVKFCAVICVALWQSLFLLVFLTLFACACCFHQSDESDADSDTDSENSTATVKTRSPVRAKRQHRPDSRLSGRREAAPLGEIGNSPAPEGRNRRGL